MTAVDFPLARHARHRGDDLALVCGPRRVSFSDLEDEVGRVAATFVDHGVVAGERVALVSGNRPEAVAVLLAAGRTGGVAVPLNTRLSGPEILSALERSAPRLVVTDAEGAEVGRAYGAAHPSVAVVELAEGPGGELHGDRPLGHRGAGPVGADAPVAIIFTSGTTDAPKGVVLTHENLVSSAVSTILDRGLGGDEVYLTGLPLFHVGGIVGLLPFLLMGRPSVLLPTGRFDPVATLALMERETVTTAYLVPTQWADVVAEARRRPRGLALRRVTYGGSHAPRPLVEDLVATFGPEVVVNSFGQTELSGAACLLQGAKALAKHGSVGGPIGAVEVRVVGDDGRDVPDGRPGELAYRGPTVMAGYWRDAPATEAALVDGWFRSGDIARRDAEGDLWPLGRRRDLILSGGENVSPAEVEEVVRTHPDVADVAVVAAPHPRWVEAPVAVLVLHPDRPAPTVEELRAHCRHRLGRYKAPRAVVVMDELPRNHMAKVLRAELRARFAHVFDEAAPGGGQDG